MADVSDAGAYAVKIHREGTWWCVFVDDRVPWYSGPAFASSKDEGEAWVSMLEKVSHWYSGLLVCLTLFNRRTRSFSMMV